MSRYETPEYAVVASRAGYEIRHYTPYLVAETTVQGQFDETGNAAFRRLAGFIFGGNSRAVKMNMTAPVTHEVTAAGSHRYRFVMERAYSEATLPQPLDDTVSINRVGGGYFAAWRYRGNRDERRYLRSKKALLDALDRDAIAVVGSAASAVYDGPLVPPPLRRNEVLVPVSYPEWRAA